MEILDSGQIQNRPMQYAGFWIRLAAAIIDGILMYIFQIIMTYGFFGSIFVPAQMYSDFSLSLLLLFFSAILAVNWLYFAGMESSSNQATIGKKAVGIKVTTTDGKQISFGRATGRYFGKFISTIIIYIGFIMAAFTEKKQALHDILARTYVINK